MKIAVIPARGGSKRIPRKNVKVFCGKPMIAWSIKAAKAAGIFDHIFVSTDDDEIANISLAYGAAIPFMRPLELSDDFAGTTAVVGHAVQWAIGHGIDVTAACCIYATAPLIQVEDIKKGYEIFKEGHWDYVFSASRIDSQVIRSFTINEQHEVEMLFPQYFTTRTQDLPELMQDAAQFYWGKPSAWINNKRIFSAHSTCFPIPSWRVQDIDNQNDWAKAEIIFNKIRGSINE
jgi:pseudaminic acid cytidylyltransferase